MQSPPMLPTHENGRSRGPCMRSICDAVASSRGDESDCGGVRAKADLRGRQWQQLSAAAPEKVIARSILTRVTWPKQCDWPKELQDQINVDREWYRR